MTHYKTVCKYGFTHSQCRCRGPHEIRVIECPASSGHSEVKRTFWAWQAIHKVLVLDPDGWRRNDGVDFDTPIDLEDYKLRVSMSTVNGLDFRSLNW